ncbi:MAG TPA: molybdopterin-dependent oxidoreductase [Syntrophales bacterium]|nr:molybdopterin-dependent oxidoreductase [Syntrophales bacterium]
MAGKSETIKLSVNGREYAAAVAGDTPLLWVLRECLGLTGTKYGCGIAQCGACTVLVNGAAIRSCVTPVSSVIGKDILTIEGLSTDRSHPLQSAWIEEDVPQCGYCQSGQIMAAAALLARKKQPSDDDIDTAMSGVLCRCGTYQRIRRAIHLAAAISAKGGKPRSPNVYKTQAVPGGCLVLGFHVPVRRASYATGASPQAFAPNAFIRIGEDETVTLAVNKSEMGQGVFTALPMLICEELEADWKKIRVASASTTKEYHHTIWGVQGTGGSTSVASEWDRLREVGAAAREMLISAAAAIFPADRPECRAENGAVIHMPSGRRLTYGRLVGKASEMEPPEDVSLKQPKDFKLIGKPALRLDTPEKTDGSALFGLDVNLPGMLTALIARSPVFGGTLKSFDAENAKAVPGMIDVFEIPSGAAVIAESFSAAKKGRDVLKLTWDEGEGGRLSTDALRDEYAKLAQKPGTVARKEGDAAKAISKATRQLIAEYDVPYLAHAPMEPLNCVVDLREQNCEIWTGTQAQTMDQKSAAKILGLEPDQVKINTMYLGGGFGRRGSKNSDFVSEAAHVARILRKPVKVMWTREDDIRGGYYRPLWYDRIEAGLNASGHPVAWRHTIVGQSILAGSRYEASMVKGGIDETSVEGAADLPYAIPNIQVDLHTPSLPVTTLWWRSVGHSHTAFVVESFIDELAHAAGKDPFEFRRALLGAAPRHLKVLELAAEKAGWGEALLPGRGRGIAVHKSFESYVAEVADVSLVDGRVKVHRVVCAVDCGMTVNPGIVAAQMESGIVFGLSAALYGAITLKDGRVQQSNYSNYPILRMKDMPEVQVHIVPSREEPSGIGEPGVPPIAPAVANALFMATGKRIRRLPISAEALKTP